MKERIAQEINMQINEEMFSAYLYLAMAADFEAKNLPGFAAWMMAQYQEEMEHAMKFYHYLNERGAKVEFREIAKPQASWNSPLEAFEASLKHEKHITGRIHTMMKAAIEEEDYATQIMLQWFVSEQVEEEASVDAVVEKLKLINNSPQGIYMLDKELGARGAH